MDRFKQILLSLRGDPEFRDIAVSDLVFAAAILAGALNEKELRALGGEKNG
jgi:hypothetical protein